MRAVSRAIELARPAVDPSARIASADRYGHRALGQPDVIERKVIIVLGVTQATSVMALDAAEYGQRRAGAYLAD